MQEQENKKKMNDAFMEIQQQQFLIFTFFKNYYIIDEDFNCR